MNCLSLLQGIFPTLGSTQVSCIAGRFFTSWVTREAQEYWNTRISLLQWIFLTQESNRGLQHCRWILYQLSYQGNPFEDLHVKNWATQKKSFYFWGLLFCLLSSCNTERPLNISLCMFASIMLIPFTVIFFKKRLKLLQNFKSGLCFLLKIIGNQFSRNNP